MLYLFQYKNVMGEAMDQKSMDTKFIVPRFGERRSSVRSAPPYLTEEGFVMVDRREGSDRRKPSQQAGGNAANKARAAAYAE